MLIPPRPALRVLISSPVFAAPRDTSKYELKLCKTCGQRENFAILPHIWCIFIENCTEAVQFGGIFLILCE